MKPESRRIEELADLPMASADDVKAADVRVWRRIGSAEAYPSPLEARIGEAEPATSVWWRQVGWAAAAVLVLAIGTAILWPRGDTALYRVVDGTVQSGDTIQTNGGGAQLALLDGSRVEMRSQSELSLERADDGLRIRLSKGGIIVHAAQQRTGHLYVQTNDMRVSVVGTVFLVNADDDGSRVAVIEGEVRVQQGGVETTLRRGDDLATNASVKAPPVSEAIAWSRNAPALVALLRQSSVAAPAVGVQSGTTPDAFEVVSIRIRPGDGEAVAGGRGGQTAAGPGPGNYNREGACTRGGLQIDPRRIAIPAAGLYTLITLAYGVGSDALSVNCRRAREMNRLSGGPAWIDSDTFDIEALLPEATPDTESRGGINGYTISPRLQRLLQALLADRFKLVIRREVMDVSGYALTVASGGPKLTPWDGEVPGGLTTGFGSYESSRNFRSVPPKYDYGDQIVGHVQGAGFSTGVIASRLEYFTRRPVVDRTGLTGKYRFEIFFAPGQFYRPAESHQGKPLLTRPSLFEVLESELGLKLEPVTERVETLVVERAERPSEN
jgi:uncharacterized protein (TIGR03435 family)